MKGLVLKITYKGDYALKTIFALAVEYNSGLLTGGDLSRRIDAPIKFLEQILTELKKGGFVSSVRGKQGGYYLSRAPEEIVLGDVIRFVEGPIEPISCVRNDYGDCRDASACVFKRVWIQVYKKIQSVVDSLTFRDLVEASGSGGGLDYSI